MLTHPKMRYTYVGIDSHKDTHCAVLIDCFFEKVGEINFLNRPSKFEAFLLGADKLKLEGTSLMFGLEDVGVYGRTLAIFLKNNGQAVKHTNALLVAQEREKFQSVTQKTDSIDAESAARVLLAEFSKLPDADPQDDYWILRTLVIRHDFLIRNNTAIKNSLHNLLTQHYPNYTSFFGNIDCKTSLIFFMRYPSPSALEGITLEDLTKFLHEPSNGRIGSAKAQEILNSLEDTAVELQEFRDMTVQSTIRQLRHNMEELEQLEKQLEKILTRFNCTLTSMNGIDIVAASQILSCIGNIKKFSTPAKLARYAGVAPITRSSGKKDLRFANQRGNRELNSLIFNLAVRVSFTVGPTNKIVNPFFFDYYRRKISEGKTKRQALKCVQRRLINIIWGMLTRGEEYQNPPMYDLPKKPKDA